MADAGRPPATDQGPAEPSTTPTAWLSSCRSTCARGAPLAGSHRGRSPGLRVWAQPEPSRARCPVVARDRRHPAGLVDRAGFRSLSSLARRLQLRGQRRPCPVARPCLPRRRHRCAAPAASPARPTGQEASGNRPHRLPFSSPGRSPPENLDGSHCTQSRASVQPCYARCRVDEHFMTLPEGFSEMSRPIGAACRG